MSYSPLPRGEGWLRPLLFRRNQCHNAPVSEDGYGAVPLHRSQFNGRCSCQYNGKYNNQFNDRCICQYNGKYNDQIQWQVQSPRQRCPRPPRERPHRHPLARVMPGRGIRAPRSQTRNEIKIGQEMKSEHNLSIKIGQYNAECSRRNNGECNVETSRPMANARARAKTTGTVITARTATTTGHDGHGREAGTAGTAGTADTAVPDR